MKTRTAPTVAMDAEVRAAGSLTANAAPKTIYHFECVGPDGQIKWIEEVPNLVVNQGRVMLLDRTFKVFASVPWYVGLKRAGAFASADTLGSAAWTEVIDYTGNRKALIVASAAGEGTADNSANKASFAINGSAGVAGGFITTGVSAGASAGELYGGSDFASTRVVQSGDTLNVTVTLLIYAA